LTAGLVVSPPFGRDAVHLPEGPMAPHPVLDGHLRGWLGEAVPRILESARASGPRALFLSGSARWGEFVAWKGDGGPWRPLSDIDLALVVDRRADSLARALRAELERAFARSRWGEALASCPIRIGTYAAHRLSRQNPMLSVAEMRRANSCLWGDASLLEAFPDPERDGVAPQELVRLCLSRSLELVEAWWRAETARPGDGPDGHEDLLREYAVSKLGSDLGMVLLGGEGTFLWGSAARSRMIARRAEEGRVPEALAARISQWTAARLAPASPTPERSASWRDLAPAAELCACLFWTWRRLLESQAEGGALLPPGLLPREGRGLRDGLRRLRRAFAEPRSGPGFRALGAWRAARTAGTYWSALGRASLALWLSQAPEAQEWRGEILSVLRPWMTAEEAGDPRRAALRLGRWTPWVRRAHG
jgi:hypothetical protein